MVSHHLIRSDNQRGIHKVFGLLGVAAVSEETGRDGDDHKFRQMILVDCETKIFYEASFSQPATNISFACCRVLRFSSRQI